MISAWEHVNKSHTHTYEWDREREREREISKPLDEGYHSAHPHYTALCR